MRSWKSQRVDSYGFIDSGKLANADAKWWDDWWFLDIFRSFYITLRLTRPWFQNVQSNWVTSISQFDELKPEAGDSWWLLVTPLVTPGAKWAKERWRGSGSWPAGDEPHRWRGTERTAPAWHGQVLPRDDDGDDVISKLSRYVEMQLVSIDFNLKFRFHFVFNFEKILSSIVFSPGDPVNVSPRSFRTAEWAQVKWRALRALRALGFWSNVVEGGASFLDLTISQGNGHRHHLHMLMVQERDNCDS